MIVTESAGSSGVGGAGNPAVEIAVHFVVAGHFGSGGNLSVVVHLVPECMGYFAEQTI